MPLWDYKCPRCGSACSDVLTRSTDGKTVDVQCVRCGHVMERQPAAPSFAVHGFSAKNGYASHG